MAKIYMKQHSSSNNTEETGIKCSSQNVITRPHQSLQCESNETTAATVSCDLAPPPQRRRRGRPPPPRNLPFVTLPMDSEFRLSRC